MTKKDDNILDDKSISSNVKVNEHKHSNTTKNDLKESLASRAFKEHEIYVARLKSLHKYSSISDNRLTQRSEKIIKALQKLPDKPKKKWRPWKADASTTAQDEAKKAMFKRIIDEFIDDSVASTYAFTPDLNAYDRLVVHKIAEDCDLIHDSVGEGKGRHILLKKKHIQDKVPEETEMKIKNKHSINDSDVGSSSANLDENEIEELVVLSNPKKSRIENQEKRRVMDAKDRFRKEIERFLHDKEAYTYKFSSDLDSDDRMIIYKLAEYLGIQHESTFDGSKRQAVVKKVDDITVLDASKNSVKIKCDLTTNKSSKDASNVECKVKNQKKFFLSSKSTFQKKPIKQDDMNNNLWDIYD